MDVETADCQCLNINTVGATIYRCMMTLFQLIARHLAESEHIDRPRLCEGVNLASLYDAILGPGLRRVI